MTHEERAEMRRLAEMAMPGPWRCSGSSVLDNEGSAIAFCENTRGYMPHERDHAQYIAAANPSAVLSLLDDADALDAAEARAALAERQVRVLAAKLSEIRGAGPCDSQDGWWPCPLVKLADGSDCKNDEGGCCWQAWSSAQAGGGDGE